LVEICMRKVVVGSVAVAFLFSTPAMADQGDFRCLQSVSVKPVLRIQFGIDAGGGGIGYVKVRGHGARIPIRRLEEKELWRGPNGRPSEFETRWRDVAPAGGGTSYVYVSQGAILDNFRAIRRDGTIVRFVDDPEAWTDHGCAWSKP
jgi:hypothetical protein